MVTIIKDKEPIYETENYDVVLLGLSTHNIFMGNFQGKMAVKYPIVEKVNNSTPYGDLRKLGKRITIDDNEPIISLMYICKYPSRKDNFIDYDALEKCLKTANEEFKGKKVMTTVLGSTKFDGKGDRDKCLKIIEENTKDLDLYIYDFPQITVREEIIKQNSYFKELRKKYKGNHKMLDKIWETILEIRKKTFLPTDMYLQAKKKKEEDDILNF
jgi:hypothetical protein